MKHLPADGQFACPSYLERYRAAHPVSGAVGNKQNGFLILKDRGLAVMFSDGMGWQHLSVRRLNSFKVPTYQQLDRLKREFWTDGCCVMQLHVPVDQHINQHEGCLHLWRPIGGGVPRPAEIMV